MSAVCLVLAGLAIGGWLLARVRTLPRGAGPVPPTSVVVPARDEEATLPALLDSLQALDPPAAEVIVVDDSSSDDTAAVAARHGALVVVAPPPPPGWLGKPWACQLGAERSSAAHLLFLDADTSVAPDALARLHGAHTTGLLSVLPHHVTVRAHEQLSAFPNLVTVMAAGRHVAFGPCLLTSRPDYDAAGGHAAVRGEVVDDVALARRYRAAGLGVRCLRGGPTVVFRMYPTGLRPLVEGWTKNLARGATALPPHHGLAIVAWVTACVAAALAGNPALYAVVALQLYWMLGRIGRFRWWTAALFPVSLAVFVVLVGRSTALRATGRAATWRGRRVPVRARR